MLCTVIDDEPYALDLIKDYINRTPFLELGECFSNPYRALSYLNSNQVDLIFLDINMPELSGIQLIRSLTSPPPVIFTTAYPEFAAESYEYNAVDYLLKPIKYERFLKAVNKAARHINAPAKNKTVHTADRMNEPREPLFVKSGHQQVKIDPDDLLYIEAAGNYMSFCTTNKKVMSLLTMKEVLDILPPGRFVRIHKSYIIARKHIEAIDKHEVVIAGEKIPIGVTYREHFLNLINKNC